MISVLKFKTRFTIDYFQKKKKKKGFSPPAMSQMSLYVIPLFLINPLLKLNNGGIIRDETID